jgi:hypothetical protein
MLRWLYIQLIWLHPAPFRWRFGDQMLDDFDRVPNDAKLRYLADAIASIARQWLFRPEFRHPQAAAVMPGGLPQTPLFQTIETWKPRPAALLNGGLLAVVSILATVALIGKGGRDKPFVIGAYYSRPGLLRMDRNSIAGSDLNTTVTLGSDASEGWLKVARQYYRSMPVLLALDTDRNFALSPGEIDHAPVALRQLDTGHAGKLTAEECGLHVDPNSVSPALRAQLRLRFMSHHPVLAGLDTDHDGEISGREIDRAAAALKKLDRNHDGYLTADELVPFEMAARAGLR